MSHTAVLLSPPPPPLSKLLGGIKLQRGGTTRNTLRHRANYFQLSRWRQSAGREIQSLCCCRWIHTGILSAVFYWKKETFKVCVSLKCMLGPSYPVHIKYLSILRLLSKYRKLNFCRVIKSFWPQLYKHYNVLQQTLSSIGHKNWAHCAESSLRSEKY